MKPKVFIAIIVGILIIAAAALYATGNLESLQGRFGSISTEEPLR